MDRATPRWGGGRIGNIISDLKKSTESFKETTQATMDAFAMFKPFMIDNDYLYRSDNVRALQSVIREKEKQLLPWYPETLDWYDYWLNVHFPGNAKMGVARLSKKNSRRSKSVLTHTKTCLIYLTRRSNGFRRVSRCGSSVTVERNNIHSTTSAN